MQTSNAVRVSLEEMQLNETPRRKRVSDCDKPYTYVFGRKLYICRADIKIFQNCHFKIYF